MQQINCEDKVKRLLSDVKVPDFYHSALSWGCAFCVPHLPKIVV